MAMKEITDDFNSLFLDARKEYLEALKAESKTQYDKFIKDLGKHCIKLVRKMRRQISGQYDGKSASRLRAKPSGGLYAVLPEFTKSFSIPSGMKWLKQISACKPFTDLSF